MSLADDVDGLEKTIYGNGQRGLKSMVEAHDILLGQLLENRKSLRNMIAGILIAVLSSICISFWSKSTVTRDVNVVDNKIDEIVNRLRKEFPTAPQ